MNEITIIKNDSCWMEHNALTQLANVAALPGVIWAIGLPDLHAGKSPVGIAIETEDIFYPHLIGNDIGCGMALFDTKIPTRKYKQDRFVTRLNYIRTLADLPTVNPFPEESPIYDLGTIGGGNHFAEFQALAEIYDQDALSVLDIDKSSLLLLVHSGSRGYGQQILQEFPTYDGLRQGSAGASIYQSAHDDALLWAKRNRKLVAGKLVDWLGFHREVRPLLDCCHNFLERQPGKQHDRFLHRKGAVSANHGMIVIPGSRGSFTYLAMPAEDTSLSADSLSHGAGRKWPRSLCKSRIRGKYDRDTIRQTELKSRVVCHDTELLYQEAPEAYKSIDQIIAALSDHGLIHVVAALRPLITFKG